MRPFRAASIPVRSSRASGSAYPFSIARLTASENLSPADTADMMYMRVPLTQPSILNTRSPVSTSLWYVSMIGRPAPTVASYFTRGPPFRDAARRAA